MIPRIETDRLILRPHRPADLDDCAAMWASPEVVKYIGGKPFSREEVWSRMLRYAGHWEWMGFGFWAMEEKSSGAFAGEMGFAEFQRDLKPSILGIPEIGWVLATQAQGRGYATEGVRAVAAWGDQKFQGARTVCLIDPENRASLRVAEKCGYAQVRQVTYNSHAMCLLERAA
ncbi:MAG: GNAT family N-acetyltransferase [Candidatus Solibacter sp.]